MRIKERKNINFKWAGLTMDLLRDIYGVHKALVFGQLQREEFTMNYFMDCIKSAETKVFKQAILSPHVSKNEHQFTLSFYPEYLVNDDLFMVMSCHFAVSSVINSMAKKGNVDKDLHVLSVVIPLAISSRYDLNVQYQQTIKSINDVQELATSECSVCCKLSCDIREVSKMANIIEKLISTFSDAPVSSTKTAITFFPAIKQNSGGQHVTVCVFGFDELDDISSLLQEYNICFEFQVSKAKVLSLGKTSRVVRCWLHFGMGQKLRYYPEYSVWIIPHLFIRSSRMTAHKVLERIYSDEYKHGWRVSLDDPVFNKYYHIITQHEHVSNNYNRDEVETEQKYAQRLLRDHLEEKLKWELALKLRQYVVENAYDSETILEDGVIDANNSNIACFGGLDDGEFRSFKFAVMQFQHMDCTVDSVRDLAECHHMDILIKNLQNFQDCGLVVDAVTVVQFDIDPLVTAFDHIVKVHGFFADAAAKLKILDFISERVVCGDGSDCTILRNIAIERRRERIYRKRELSLVMKWTLFARSQLMFSTLSTAICFTAILIYTVYCRTEKMNSNLVSRRQWTKMIKRAVLKRTKWTLPKRQRRRSESTLVLMFCSGFHSESCLCLNR